MRYFAASILAFVPYVALGAIVPCDGPDCTPCHIAVLAQNILTFIIEVMVVLAGIAIAWAGLMMATSAGDISKVSRAKEIFTNVVVGLVIVLAAYLIIDTVIKLFVDEGKLGQPWNQIECTAGVGVVSQAPPSPGGVVTTAPSAPDGVFSYQSGIAAQRSSASNELNELLNCMAGKLPGNVGIISSISDSRIVNGQDSFGSCATNGCAHTAGSCHYGGTKCTGSSYAVDFGDQQNASALITAAKECNSSAYTQNEGDHVHISVGAACGCS